MNFFTSELLDRFSSEDDAISIRAHDELERASEEYAQRLRTISPKLPPRFREMLEQFYLHDARVAIPNSPRLPAELYPSLFLSFTNEESRTLSLILHLDPPPQEFLVLQYRGVWRFGEFPGRSLAPGWFLEWAHDEIDLRDTETGVEFVHSILFSNGAELDIHFRDFDFATLKPLSKTTAKRVHPAEAQ
jgi:hypothetical protein